MGHICPIAADTTTGRGIEANSEIVRALSLTIHELSTGSILDPHRSMPVPVVLVLDDHDHDHEVSAAE